MKVDPDFIRGGYFEMKNGKRVVRADLIAEHAQAYGEFFAKNRNAQVSSSQLRAFYSDVKALEQKITQGGGGAFDRYYYLIKMLKSKASYVQGKRSGGRVSEAFRDYVHKCVDAIETEDDFKAFLKFFESTVGFYYGAGGERIR
ncbi:MAG: type III-A CRISPR-associated protein Csm2 [Chloroflexota bacterium]|nr:type III-A CRISPR-associated protein Csm2 [Chloroflexota bacterium]